MINKIVLLLLVLVMSSVSAQAQSFFDAVTWRMIWRQHCDDRCKARAVMTPPERFVHSPSVPVKFLRSTGEQLKFACIESRGREVRECTDRWRKTPTGPVFSCTIRIHEDAGPLETATLTTHAIAHCNGWEHGDL